MSSVTPDLLHHIIGPVVAAEGLDLEQLDVSAQGRRRMLRVVVDADGGVDLERCADTSQLIAKALDDSNVMGESPYTLEVTTPGVSRPLSAPRHWSRAVGRLVRVAHVDGSRITGRIVSAGENSAVVAVDDAVREVFYDDVSKAKVQVEFRRAEDDGGEG